MSEANEPMDVVEAAYWEFDARRKGYGTWKTMPQSERDSFKQVAGALYLQEPAPCDKADSRHPITCDQVAWMLGAINRYLPTQTAPAVSRYREATAYALLYELMEVAGLRFMDAAAQHNATPRDVFLLMPKGEPE
jgi:hypothetical protein